MFPARAYAAVDLDAIRANTEEVMKKVGDGVKIMSIIKTDAYGHGAVPVARELASAGVYAFGVACVEEGAELRRAGIDNPILILGHVFSEDYEELLKNELMPAVFTYENAKELNDKARWLNKTARVHIKVDTGMGRIGFQPNRESIADIKKINQLSNVEIDGIFTHFACADMRDKTSCNAQKKIYLDFLKMLKLEGIDTGIRHMDNSAGIIDYQSDFLDMVRVGIMGYGLYPSDEVNAESFPLKPALELKASVAFVKSVKRGFTISYGSTFTAQQDMEIATVSFGYGDGYPRSLSNRGVVLINGQYAKIVGRVCMDQFMVDVTGLGVKQGDSVTLVGTDGANRITVDELAQLSDRFNYEFCCDINRRVPRVYLKNGKIAEVVDYIKA